MAKKRRSIQQKIVIALLVVGFLPGFVGVFFTYLSGTKALKDSIGANFQTIAIETSEKIDLIIQEKIRNARTLAISPPIIAAVKGERNRQGDSVLLNYLQRFQREQGENIISIAVADEKGHTIGTAGRPLSTQGPDKRFPDNTIRNGRNGRNGSDGKEPAFVGGFHFDTALQEYPLWVSVPIKEDQNAGGIGNIMVLYNVKEVFEVINNIRIGKTGHANLVASDGTLLACPLFPPGTHTINDRLLRQIAMPQPGWGVAHDDAHGGKDSIIGFSPVKITLQMGKENFGGQKWYLFIRQLPKETYAPIYVLLWRVSILGFTIVGILSLLGYFLARRIVGPVRMLSEGAKLIGQGHLDHHLKITTGDEIEELAGIFNQMARDLEKRFQEIRLEKQRLLNSERLSALSQFSSTFAHDLRNPIIAVKKTIEMLKDSYPFSQDDTIKGIYCDLISTCGLLLGLVNDVLDVHQVSYRDLPLLYSSFSLKQALEEVIRLLHIEAEDKKVHVDMIEESEDDVQMEGDRRRIQRVFINLLSNALRYSPAMSTIRISFKTSSAPVSSETNHLLQFKIEDEGPGIPPEDLSKIFDLFYNSDKSGIKPGTGLGLYFCKVVVEAHDGRIWAGNRTNGGAAFFVEMPLVRREKDAYQDSYSR
ncbi:MAG: sensor histidine kinase [Nitrospirae bacterium]|nr:sensor histidine kinase [Nitrospirota bacterium]